MILKLRIILGENEWLRQIAKKRDDIHFDIVTLDNDKLIGTISLDSFDYVARNAVLGIFIGDSEYRSHG